MPRDVIIQNLSRPDSPTVQAKYCDSFLCRLRGLMFRRDLPEGSGVLLVGEKESRMDASIHMLFMWMDLKVVWFDSSRRVVDVRLARRWRLAYVPVKPARFVLEISPSNRAVFEIGDWVDFKDVGT